MIIFRKVPDKAEYGAQFDTTNIVMEETGVEIDHIINTFKHFLLACGFCLEGQTIERIPITGEEDEN